MTTDVAIKTKKAPKKTIAIDKLCGVLAEALEALNEGVALHPIEAEKMKERIAMLTDIATPEVEEKDAE